MYYRHGTSRGSRYQYLVVNITGSIIITLLEYFFRTNHRNAGRLPRTNFLEVMLGERVTRRMHTYTLQQVVQKEGFPLVILIASVVFIAHPTYTANSLCESVKDLLRNTYNVRGSRG